MSRSDEGMQSHIDVIRSLEARRKRDNEEQKRDAYYSKHDWNPSSRSPAAAALAVLNKNYSGDPDSWSASFYSYTGIGTNKFNAQIFQALKEKLTAIQESKQNSEMEAIKTFIHLHIAKKQVKGSGHGKLMTALDTTIHLFKHAGMVERPYHTHLVATPKRMGYRDYVQHLADERNMEKAIQILQTAERTERVKEAEKSGETTFTVL